MLYRVIKNVINAGNYECEDMQLKLDVFLAKNRITVEEYEELSNMIVHTCGKEDSIEDEIDVETEIE